MAFTFITMEQKKIKEEWRPAVGFEGLYEVSNLGNVNSLNYHREKCRKPMKIWNTKLNYKFVILYKNGEPHKMHVHRLVAMAFIPNPQNLPIINHKDEKPYNNKVDNLEWCDNNYNLNYGTRLKRISEKKRKQIIQKDKDGNIINVYNSMKEAAAQNGLWYENISKVCRGKRNFCGGFKWEYIDEDTKNRAKRRSKEEIEKEKSKVTRKTVYQRQVEQYTRNGVLLKEFNSIYDAFSETGINRRAILENCRGNRKWTHNYIFKFKN